MGQLKGHHSTVQLYATQRIPTLRYNVWCINFYDVPMINFLRGNKYLVELSDL